MSDTQALDSGTLSYDQASAPFAQPLTTSQNGEGRALSPGAMILPDELDVFHDFTGQHLRPLANGDVQCMLIWAEWVRYHLRQAKGFPRLIGEAEFNYLITGLFNTRVALDDHRGRIYPGIRFVP